KGQGSLSSRSYALGAEGGHTENLGGGRTQPGHGWKEDTPLGHLDPGERTRGVAEPKRLREERRRVRNKFVLVPRRPRHSLSCP
ncbi:hypothetical protein PANDA_010570, partial [Ailuropoda melanoleuca]